MTPKDEFLRFASTYGLDDTEPEITTHKARLKTGLWIHDNGRPRRFPLKLIFGFFPAVFCTHDKLRRLAGMTWKAIWNMPDRVALQKKINAITRSPQKLHGVLVEWFDKLFFGDGKKADRPI